MRNTIQVLLIFAVYFTPFLSLIAQNTQIDSLKTAISTHQQTSEIEKELQALLALGEAHSTLQNDSMAIAIFEEGIQKMPATIELKIKEQFYYQLAQSCQSITTIRREAAYYEKAAAINLEALKLFENSEDQLTYGKLLASHATQLLSAGKDAKPTFYQTIKILQNETPSTDLAIAYLNLGIALHQEGQPDSAIILTREALTLCKELKNDWYTLATYKTLGDLLSANEETEEAKALFEKGLAFAESTDTEHYRAVFLCSLGFMLTNPDCFAYNPEEGKDKLLAALDYFTEKRDEFHLCQSYYSLSMFYGFHKKDFPTSFEYSKKAETAAKRINLTRIMGKIYEKRGEVFRLNNQLDSALTYVKKGIEYIDYSSFDAKVFSYGLLAELQSEQGNFAEAYENLQSSMVYRDSIFDQKMNQTLASEKAQLFVEREQAAREKAELTASLLASKNQLFLAISIGLFSVLLIGGFLFFQLFKTRKKLEAQNLQLNQLNQTKDKFFGIIAHDIRSPIVALDGIGQQIDFYLERQNPEKLNRLTGLIDSTTKSLNALLDNLLNWALLQTGMIPYDPKSVKIADAVRETFQLFEPTAEMKNIQLHSSIDPNLEVFADKRALNTILRNLVSNAIKFTPEAGKVSVSIDSQIDKIAIIINDTGTGIEANKIERLFDLKKESKKGTSGEKGTGLGLLLVKELVELNKGILNVKSIVGKGSQFVFSLPKVVG